MFSAPYVFCRCGGPLAPGTIAACYCHQLKDIVPVESSSSHPVLTVAPFFSCHVAYGFHAGGQIMAKRCWLSLSLAALMPASTTAQDPRNVLQAAATAMGVNNMRSIQYTGTGWQGMVGQNFAAYRDWLRVGLTA